MAVSKRTILFAPVGSDKRPWSSSSAVLDNDIHNGKSSVSEFEPSRLVVCHEYDKGQGGNGTIHHKILKHPLNFRYRSQGTSHQFYTVS